MAEEIDVALTVNGERHTLRVGTDHRLLDVLRDRLRLTGAKEGCGRGECGSCTVLVDGKAVNSCLMLAYQADATAVETIEGLAPADSLHPLQEAFIAQGAVQCGACVPGMILAARAFLQQSIAPPKLEEIRRALAGNLCRCTGYQKVFAAVIQAAGARSPAPAGSAPEPAAPSYFRPRSLEEALEILIQRSGELRPVAGGTHAIARAAGDPSARAALFDVTAVPELQGIDDQGGHLRIGAAVTLAELAGSKAVGRHCPALPLACGWIGGPQVRNRATLGGNVATALPDADTVPALVAADATLELVSVSDRREVPVAEFATGPGTSVLAPDELILAVRVPKRPGIRAAALRLAQRAALSRSKITMAVAMTFRDGRPDWVRVALGAVGRTVLRARETEKALMAGGYDSLRQAMDAVRQEVRPADDLRSTAEYRREMAAVLLQRAIRQITEG
jgi:carbon-monoxide dehydrogenase small subunit/xanthine dehydrogenase small subunit